VLHGFPEGILRIEPIQEPALQPLAGALGRLDVLIVAVGVLLLLAISYTFARGRDTRDFFLGRRRVPAVVACLSFVAGEISALTIVGFPATA